jgi:hypothetical protein
VITGFNTDIEHNGITYHIQTEDKGLNTPLILSLVYNHGTILASKRSPYDDLLEGDFNESAVAERLQKQHKLICAAVLAGRIEDLKQMTVKDSAAKAKSSAAQKAGKSKNNGHHQALPATEPKKQVIIQKIQPPQVSQQNAAPAVIEEESAPPIPQPKEELVWELPLRIVEEAVLAEDAVEIVTNLSKAPKTEAGKLSIEFLTETDFKGGERKTLSIRVFRGKTENCVDGANIMVKILGSSFRPLIFHARTDSNGIAIVHLQLPHFRAGRGAILVRAMSEGEEVELRHIIRQG